MSRITLASMCLVAPWLLLAQSDAEGEVHHHNFVFGVGPAIPVGNSTNYLGAAPLIRLGYGYRFNRLFQADAGFQVAFGAANNQNPEVTDFGSVQGGDHEFMIPLGGRVYIPQPLKKFQVSAGGGTIYLHYSETAPSNPYYPSSCYTCTSRGGWGGYGLADVSYFQPQLSRGHHCSVHCRLYQWAGGRQYPGGGNHRPLGQPGFRFRSELLRVTRKTATKTEALSEMRPEKPTISRNVVPSASTRRFAAARPVVLASSRIEDLERIPALLPREQWMLIKVASWTHVLQLLGAVILPIVLCDRELPGLEWPHGLAQLRRSSRPPALVLLSDLAAPSLWEEVIRYGGFDILFRPLCRDRLVAALDLASTHWDMCLDGNAETEIPLGR